MSMPVRYHYAILSLTWLQDVLYSDLEQLVTFIYSGEIVVQPNHVQSIIKTGEILKIKGWLVEY